MTKLKWTLPDKDELSLVYKRLYVSQNNIGSFKNCFYWSRSEYDRTCAWYQGFNTFGYQGFICKQNKNKVRLVRSFESLDNYNIGDKTNTGIIFYKDSFNCVYKESKFKDEDEIYAWDEAVGLFK